MNSSRTLTVICSTLLMVCMAASVMISRRIDAVREGAALREVLWIPSSETVKRMSLGYNGLLADLYWTRVVQYFGGRHATRSRDYELLEPLLDIATDLDPKLMPAYESGGVFLAQEPPQGAGDPKAAARFVEKGIRNNPDAWRLYYTLGFIYWMELKDYKQAANAFQRGSEVPGAHSWMGTMAATLAQHAGERATARYMWVNILNSTNDEMMKQTARERLIGLNIDEMVDQLQARVDQYTKATGRSPSSFAQLKNEGWLSRIPLDPRGRPYEILNGHVEITNYKNYPYITRGLPAGEQASDLPKVPSK